MPDKIASLTVLIFVGHVKGSPRAGGKSFIATRLWKFASLKVQLLNA